MKLVEKLLAIVSKLKFWDKGEKEVKPMSMEQRRKEIDRINKTQANHSQS